MRGAILPNLRLHRQPLQLPRPDVVLEVDEARCELLLQRLGKTKTNKEFLAAIAKSMEEK